MVQSQTGGECFLEHKSDKKNISCRGEKILHSFLLVVEQQRERRWEGLGLDMESQETYREVNLQDCCGDWGKVDSDI